MLGISVFGRDEFSGYAPWVQEGNNFRVLDLYILSDDNSGGHTDLSPEAVVKAWSMTMAQYPDEQVGGLAWMHRHLGDSAYWSSTDDDAVSQLVEGCGQLLSFEVAGHNFIARWDTRETREQVTVNVEWGEYADAFSSMNALRESSRKAQRSWSRQKPEGVIVPGGRALGQQVSMCTSCGGVYTTLRCDLCDGPTCMACGIAVGGLNLCAECAKTFSEMECVCSCCGQLVPLNALVALDDNVQWCEKCMADHPQLAMFFREHGGWNAEAA